MIYQYLAALNEFADTQNNLKQKAIDEYKKALLMPRKKKKIAKKSALLLYSIATFDLYENKKKIKKRG